jgi:hypothetical protein
LSAARSATPKTYLNKVLRDRGLARQVDGADLTLNEYLDQWLETAAKPRLREKSYAATKACCADMSGPRSAPEIWPQSVRLISRRSTSNSASAVCQHELRELRVGWRFAETKRNRSRRVIKLQEWVLKLLKDLSTRTNPKSACSGSHGVADLVFTTPSGRPIHADKLATKFKAILQKADLPMMRLYDLRHTTATTRPGGWRSANGGV